MKRFLIHYVIIITILISIIFGFFPVQQVELGYDILWIQPVVFLFIYLIICIPMIKKSKYKVTVYSYVFLAWLRCVIIPLGSFLTGIYNGVSYIVVDEHSVRLAILLVSFELIITSVFMYLLIKIRIKGNRGDVTSKKNHDLQLGGNKYIYAGFIIFAVILYVLVGRKLDLVQFFIITVSTGTRRGDLDSTLLVLIRQIFTTAFMFIFVWYTSYNKKKYEVTGKSKYVNFTTIVGILNIGLIIGERRTAQLYTGFVVMFILIYAFKEHKKKIISIISVCGISVLLLMSIYKHFSAFAHGSYYSALSESDMNLGMLTATLQSYFFGTQNVAAVIEMTKFENFNIVNMLYDFGRSTFGLSFLLKGRMVLTTEVFNTYVYGRTVAAGHIVSGIGYGYLYLGALISPALVCVNIFISIKLEKWFNKTKSFEMKYITGYMLVRFATSIFSNTPQLINVASIILFTSGTLYFTAKVFSRPNKLVTYKLHLNNQKSFEVARHS